MKEFAAKGFAGARVDAVARRAKINKRMLYHYFGDKERLFLAVLRRKIAERQSQAEAAPDNPAENLTARFTAACNDLDWIRLLKWEALQNSESHIVDESERKLAAAQAVKRIQRQQAAGHLEVSLEPRFVLMAMLALTVYPLAFPQLTQLITGQSAFDAGFQKEYAGFLRRFAAVLQPSTQRGNGKK